MEVVEHIEHEIGWSSDLERALDVIGGPPFGHHHYEKNQDTRNTDENLLEHGALLEAHHPPAPDVERGWMSEGGWKPSMNGPSAMRFSF
jgi:hypothetical protein